MTNHDIVSWLLIARDRYASVAEIRSSDLAPGRLGSEMVAPPRSNVLPLQSAGQQITLGELLARSLVGCIFGHGDRLAKDETVGCEST